jgi:hypothetical protein
MDLIIIDVYNKKEDNIKRFKTIDTPQSGISKYQVFSFMLGVLAMYLCYTCNIESGTDKVLSMIYSVFAFFFGGLYLVYYALVRAGRCVKMVPAKK